MTAPDILGYVAACLTTGASLPQAVQLLRTRDARGVSVTCWSIMSIGVALWLLYGYALKSAPIIVANGLTLLLDLAIVVLAIGCARREQLVAAARASRAEPDSKR